MLSTLFTNRHGGVSSPPYATNNLGLHVGDERVAVRANRDSLASTFGPIVYMNQSHGDQVVVIDGFSDHEVNADALVTQEPNIALAVLVADCIPLLLWEDAHSCVAAVHVGRRGLVNGVALRAIEIMQLMGAGDIHALLGPSICGRCYEVGQDIHAEVADVFPVADSRTPAGSLALDLPRALVNQLSDMGVLVTPSTICTVENPDFYSYRRDGVTGRQAGVIRL
ncbi:MAG: peptidoglycan editing factor PgeF [Candidatus Nanopelagicaceae bacterium]|nr:peptidoglycan editing factor PgeF [Candidatus Nanopelagicaceae bacterium]